MKTILILMTLLFLAFPTTSQNVNPNYDSTLAKSLGADKFGMKQYVLVILKTGSNDV